MAKIVVVNLILKLILLKKKKIDVFSRENKLSDSLPERFSNILPYQFEPEKKENAEETLCLLLWLKSRIAGKAFTISFYGQLPNY